MKYRILALLVLTGSLAGAQTLLFSSGFESTTALGSVPGGQTCSYSQPFSGTDASTGFTWPPTLFGGVVGLKDGGTCADVLVNHFFNNIVTETSHTGASGKALHVDIRSYPNFTCCPQATLQSSSLTQPMQSVYYSFWLMYPASLAPQIDGISTGYGREVSGWKSNTDYREALDIGRNGTTGHILKAHIQADAGGKLASNTNQCPHADPITGATDNDCSWHGPYSDNKEYIIPFGQWFHVEIYMSRVHGPGGKFFAAIDGHTIADYTFTFDSYGILNEEIADFYWVNLYSSYFPMSHDIDDLQVWSAPPCANLPCDTHVGGLPSSVISYPAAVGTVGVPFSFQPTATNGANIWNWNGYNGSSMPPGLSLNTSTGFLSGTPTTAGTYKIFVNGGNTFGGGSQIFEFQINSSTTAPVIKTFGAYPTTVPSGGPSTLYSNVLGAGTVTLSVNQGVGTLTGLSTSKTVTPAVTTTYTLTASNSAGTATASTTVFVAPAISSFTATPVTVTPGASTTLNWTTLGATTLTLNPGAINVTGTTSRVVTPAANTTYTLTATNSSGSTSSSASVFLAIRRVGQEAGIQFSSPPTNPFCQYGEYQRAPAAAFGGTCSNFLKMYDIFPSIYNPDQSNQSIPLALVNQYAIKVVWTDNNTYNGYGAYLGDSTGLNIADVNFQNYYWGNYTPNVTIANFQTKTGTTVTTSNPLYISADAWFEPYSTWGANVNGVRQTPVVWAAGYPQNQTAWSQGWQAFMTAAKNQAPSIRLSPHIATQDPIVWVNFHTIYGDCPAIEKEHFPLSEPVSDANHRLQVYNAIVNFYWFANVATPVFPNIVNEPPTRVTQWGTDIDQTVSTDLHTSLALYALSRGTNSFFDLITTGNITADPTLWQPTAALLGIVNNAGAPTATVIATGHVLGDGWNLMVRSYPGGIAYYNMTGTVQHPVPPPGAKDWVGNPVTSLTLADGQGEVLLTAAVPGPTRISGAILNAISVH